MQVFKLLVMDGAIEAQHAFERIQDLLREESSDASSTSMNHNYVSRDLEVSVLFWTGDSVQFTLAVHSDVLSVKKMAADLLCSHGMGRFTAADLEAFAYEKPVRDTLSVGELGLRPEIYLTLVEQPHEAEFQSPSAPAARGMLDKDIYVSPYRSHSLPPPRGEGGGGVSYGSVDVPEGDAEECSVALLPQLLLQEQNPGFSPMAAPTTEHHAEVARLFGLVSQSSLDSIRAGRSDDIEACAIAERDVWNLLDLCCRAELLRGVDGKPDIDTSWRTALGALSVTASAAEVESEILQADSKLRKGAVLVEWLEEAAAERVLDPVGAYDTSLAATFEEVRRGSKSNTVQSAHPDSHLVDGKLFSVAQGDSPGQSQLWQCLWSLVRAGALQEAQELAHRCGMYSLAASLSGASEAYQKEGSLSDDVSFRVGNLRRAIWKRTASSYAERLYEACTTSDDGGCARYEVAIYAALSDNVSLLLRSELMEDWRDRLWAVLKAAHAKNITRVHLEHSNRQNAHSRLYPQCDSEVLGALETQVDAFLELELDTMSAKDVLRLTGEPVTPHEEEQVLQRLQLALIGGWAGMDEWIRNELSAALPMESGVWCSPRILRVCCHLCLWIRQSALAGTPKELSLAALPSLSDTIYYEVIEKYCKYLISVARQDLVAPYCVFLSAPRRVRTYVALLRSISPTLGGSAAARTVAANKALSQATLFFDPAEVMQIAADAARDEGADALGGGADVPSSAPSVLESTQAQVTRVETKDILQINQSMQRMQWLLLDPSHHLEAVQQACFVASSIMTSPLQPMEKVLEVERVLKLLPSDSEECGWALLRLEHKRVQEQHADAIEVQALALREKRWRSCLLQLQFWRGYVEACTISNEAIVAAEDSVAVPRSKQASERLGACADRSLSSILHAIRGDSSTGVGAGAGALWLGAEAGALSGAQLSLLASRQAYEADAYVSLLSEEELKARVESASRTIDTLYPAGADSSTAGNAGHSTVQKRRMQLRSESQSLIALLEEKLYALNNAAHCDDAASRSQLGDAVNALQSALTEVATVREAGSSSVVHLINLHAAVCVNTANAVQFQVDGKESFLYWHSRACSLAVTLADPDPSLQLYDMIPKDALAASVGELGVSAAAVIDGRGGFELELS